MSAPVIINARIAQADISNPEWAAKDPILLKGEAFDVLDEDGKIKGRIIGDGIKKLSQLDVSLFGGGGGGGGGDYDPDFDDEPTSGSNNLVNSGKLYIWGQDFVIQVEGKDLSDNNFSNDDKQKLDNLPPAPEPIEFDAEPTNGSNNLLDSDAIFGVLQNYVEKNGDKTLTDNNFSDDYKNKLDNLPNEGDFVKNFEDIGGNAMDNASIAEQINAIWIELNTKATMADVTTEVMSKAYYLPTTGTQVRYDRYRIYGLPDSPATGNLTDTISSPYEPKTYAQGTIFLQVGSSASTLPTRFNKISGDMVLNSVNVINYTYISSTQVDYTIFGL